MADDVIQDILERLTKIETLLEGNSNYEKLQIQLLEEKIKVANNRISDLESSNTWLWRAIAGALISAAMAFLLK